MNGAESDVMVVVGILTLFYRIIPTVAGEGPAVTATRNYVARDSDGARWFLKSYPAGTDLDAERQALEFGQFARLGRIPVPVVRQTLDGDRLATTGGIAVSVAAYVEETAEGGLSGDRWVAVGDTVGRLHRALARHPAGPTRRVPAREVISPQMLHQARQALTPVLGHCTLTLVHASADAYEPLATLPGEPDSGPDLITCCRSYHWMNGKAVLGMADRVAAPGAAVAIMGDGSLWTHDADSTRALRELIQRYLGAERRAGVRPSYAEPRRSYEDDLAASAFNDVTEHLFPVTRTWAPQEVLGYLRTTSFAAPELFAERLQAFEEEASTFSTRTRWTGLWSRNRRSGFCSPDVRRERDERRAAAHRAGGRPPDPAPGDRQRASGAAVPAGRAGIRRRPVAPAVGTSGRSA
ncbi:phosphotransferase [Streptomyces phaeoluteigriseus]|uniref:Phosphotransferase n=1 Tax=Streptomyces phaeoluteigriseus TaxID=114686 RepID=A0ABY4Z9S7_9ACTN|nr:phosphotransferase [Streptomyces phaeoluteigriseus]USQ85792.1 phosphotransferase [Streptomyces phaeoluteigriseus]